MKKVLIVTPNWPPIAYPDMQRVRMAAPYFRQFGWEPLILSLDPDEQPGVKDALLQSTLPMDLKKWQAKVSRSALASLVGAKSVVWRSLFNFATLGSRIIAKEAPAAVFFSTTMFPLFVLGPYWRRRHGIPYVLDFQDPWVSDYREAANRRHWFSKRNLADALARILEPRVVRSAAQIICVSPDYPRSIVARYPDVPSARFSVLPFCATDIDFRVLRNQGIGREIFNRGNGRRNWVYVGRGGADMQFAVRAFFNALSAARSRTPEQFRDLRVHFIGTDYAPAPRARKTIEPVAEQCGVADMVAEFPERIPYFEALRCLEEADALIVPGSDDPGYTASKIYPYIMARRPMLGVFHERSSVVDVFARARCGTLVKFASGESVASVSERILRDWFTDMDKQPPDTDWEYFDRYSAPAMTEKICGILDRASQQ